MDGDWRALAHAEMLLELRRDAEAEQRFRDVLATDPGSVRALLGLARALNRQDRHEEAEQVVRSAVALAPEDETGYHVLVDVLCDRQDGEGALRAAERALRLAPHDVTSHYQHARALLTLRRPRVRDAYDAAVRAVGLAPHSPDAHNLVGMCLGSLGDLEGAERAYRNALALEPHHTMAQNNLAATELDRGRLRSAAGMLRHAVGAAPQEKILHENLDTVLLRLGRRIVWSLLAAALTLGVLLVSGAPWWSRALAGAAYVATLGVLLHRFGDHLPRGVSRWGRGMFGRAGWQGRYLIGLLALLSCGVLLLAFAPYGVAAASGIVLVSVLRVLGIICVMGWVGMAAVNLVRGR